ncbi:MAG: hypothetical protein PUB18_04915 [bacterium]|nr:hypothetical protein [bacterium]
MSNIPKCPNCEKQMVIVWYHEPNEIIEEFINEKKCFYRGLDIKNEDRESPNRIKYHCYNCNRSYSSDLKKHVVEIDSMGFLKKAQKELDNIVNELADRVINDIEESTKEELKSKPEYSHFGFGLYIRNKFIYGNDKIKYRLEADHLSHLIYDKILEKILN